VARPSAAPQLTDATAPRSVSSGPARSLPPLGLLASLLLTAAIGLHLALQPAHPLADVSHYKLWARLGALDGIASFYSGVYPESYAIYPPVLLYAMALVGHLYQSVDPSFDLPTAVDSQWLTTAIRLVALSIHLVLGAVLYRLVAPLAGSLRATIGSAVYLLNPGALWDVAVWGQPDSWHSLFAVLGVWSIASGWAARGGAWLALAACTKPQAWVVLPLCAVGLLRRASPAGWLRAGLAGTAVVVLVLSPFLATGRLRQVLTLPGQISSVMPVASAHAHNLWWLVTRGVEPFVFDSERLAGLPLSFRQAALLLLLPLLAFSLWQAWRQPDRWELCGLAAYTAHGWFCLTTAAHENHPFLILPFLCLVWWRARFLALVLGLLVVTFSLNVLLHDFGLDPDIQAALGRWNYRLQMAASALNLLILIAWTAWLARAPLRSTDAHDRGEAPTT
jgi:hypothetical protein